MTLCSTLIAVVLSNAAACSLIGCGNSQAVPVAPPSAAEPEHEQAPPVAARASEGPAPRSAATPVFSNCVLHAGDAHTKKHQQRGPGGKPGPTLQEASCSFNAECIARHGEDTEGDGFVSLACKNDDCSCLLEPVTPPSAAVEFQFRAPCTTSEQAQQLLLDHCLKGMHVVAGQASTER